jgi:hypothetical protein
MSITAFDNYHQLLNKIDRFSVALRHKYPQSFACQPGCARCCVPSIRVWRVEHDRIGAFLKDHPLQNDHRGREDRCQFLDGDSRCSIYDARPIVCRLWGLPIFIPAGRAAEWTGAAPSTEEQRAEGTLTCCELNFTENPRLEDLPLADAINAETVIQTLAAINHVYCKECGLDPAERRTLETPAER